MFLFAITPKEYQEKLKLGINVNWASFKRYVKHEYYKDAAVFKKLGFNSVRIRFTNPEKFSMTEKEYLAFLKKCVDEALKNTLVPVLAYSSKDLNNNPNIKTIQKNADFWKKVAITFKDYPDILSYDLLIEPAKKLNKNTKMLLSFYSQAIKEIRKVDNGKIIFIAPSHASNPYYLNELLPIIRKKPKNIMIEWHYYAAGPSPKNKKKLWTNGSKYEKKLITNKAEYAKKWCKKHHLYSWVGAIMPGNYNKGNSYTLDEQIKFMKEIINTHAKLKIPFAINADGQFYDYKKKKLKREKVLKFISEYYHRLF